MIFFRKKRNVIGIRNRQWITRVTDSKCVTWFSAFWHTLTKLKYAKNFHCYQFKCIMILMKYNQSTRQWKAIFCAWLFATVYLKLYTILCTNHLRGFTSENPYIDLKLHWLQDYAWYRLDLAKIALHWDATRHTRLWTRHTRLWTEFTKLPKKLEVGLSIYSIYRLLDFKVSSAVV